MDNYNNNNDLGYGYDEFSSNEQRIQDAYSAARESFYGQDYGQVVTTSADVTSVTKKAFAFMTIALIITALAALATPPSLAMRMMEGSSFMVLVIAELAIVLISNFAIKKNNIVLAGVLYTAYSFLTGMLFSVLLVFYTTESIAVVFGITAAMFGIMCFFGFVTKMDLTRIGSICMMGLLGIIIASVVNMFILRSSGFDMIISYVGVVIFVGLTAYDVQKMKRAAMYSDESYENALALFGAFELYLDFVNLFLKLLSILGKRK